MNQSKDRWTLPLSLRSLHYSFILLIRRMLNSQPKPYSPPIGCRSAPVETWYTSLREHAVKADEGHIPMIKAVQIGRNKQKHGAKHEYFFAKVDHPDGTTCYLRIERSGEEYTTSNGRQRALVEASPSIEKFMSRPAIDQLVTKNALPDNDKRLETVNAPDITLLDLAIAASVVRAYNEEYSLLRSQCYWFSDMVMRVLEAVYKLPVDRSKESKQADREWTAEQANVNVLGGKWNGIAIHKAREEHVQLLAVKFLEEHKRVQNEVEAAEAEHEAKRIEAEAKIMERGIEMGIERGMEMGMEIAREEARANREQWEAETRERVEAELQKKLEAERAGK